MGGGGEGERSGGRGRARRERGGSAWAAHFPILSQTCSILGPTRVQRSPLLNGMLYYMFNKHGWLPSGEAKLLFINPGAGRHIFLAIIYENSSGSLVHSPRGRS